jgi:hypothetical protein
MSSRCHLRHESGNRIVLDLTGGCCALVILRESGGHGRYRGEPAIFRLALSAVRRSDLGFREGWQRHVTTEPDRRPSARRSPRRHQRRPRRARTPRPPPPSPLRPLRHRPHRHHTARPHRHTARNRRRPQLPERSPRTRRATQQLQSPNCSTPNTKPPRYPKKTSTGSTTISPPTLRGARTTEPDRNKAPTPTSTRPARTRKLQNKQKQTQPRS